MATIREFEDLEIWQKARQLCKDLNPILQFMHEMRQYELARQLDRSSGSVMDNIAEGFDRSGNRELIQFLAIAKGSLGEVRSQLHRAADRLLLEEDTSKMLNDDCKDLSNQIGKFIGYLKRSDMRGAKFNITK